MRRGARWIAALASAAAAACHPATELDERRASPVIYGQDDRHEVFEDPDPAWRTLARDSLVALVPARSVDASDPANVRLLGPTFGETYALCPGEPYAGQTAAAVCTGVLVGEDLVLTAGHCIQDAATCQATSFVFHDHLEAAGTLATISAADVFACRALAVIRLDLEHDHAIVRLDRAATPEHHPAAVAPQAPLAGGEPVSLLGFPGGVPAKIAHGGAVLHAGEPAYLFFEATVDAYAGNSGGPVFLDATREVVGILSSGNEDFVRQGGCFVSNVLAQTPPSAEVSSYAFRAADDACLAGVAGAPCSGRVVCGDRVCAEVEEQTCAADCPPALTGGTAGGGGCGCGAGASGVPLLALVALGLLRRGGNRAAPRQPQTSQAVFPRESVPEEARFDEGATGGWRRARACTMGAMRRRPCPPG